MILGRESAIVLVILVMSIGALVAISAYRIVYTIRRRAYPHTPGAIIYADRVQINGDGGPRTYPWSDFGSAFVAALNGRPVIQHLETRDLGLDGYRRFSSYMLTPVDHIAMPAEAFLDLLRKQPGFPDVSVQENSEIA